jgi:hypothetical protein
VTHYTIRYRSFRSGGWTFFSQEVRHPLIAKAGLPGYNGELIGPNNVSLWVDGGGPFFVPAYLNMEPDSSCVSAHRNRRA